MWLCGVALTAVAVWMLSLIHILTLDKFICYSTSLDMEKEKLEAFVQDELAAAKSEGYELSLIHI